ncbi:hypothetical protein CDL15_Pgr010369 [Punica granatum]|uniref:Protein OCTOPUS-like n=1 Tax=Punica granatum TaxID=22663 RepID=A0A218W2M5_PUNGR|nr:hypothetical protein CDL15_Pgr010369 [Punica granatum]PKI32258.1 hypothetical protein CRG98_047344 [Punica granatum]
MTRNTGPDDRRLTTCHRHPTAGTSVGFCPSCLCERLASVDPSTTPRLVLPDRPPRPDHQLQRSRSYSVSATATATSRDGVNEPPRNSCDSRTQGSLLGHSSPRREHGGSDRELRPGAGEIRICERRNEESVAVDGDFEVEAELRTVREFIELELHSKKQTRKIHRSFREFGDKSRKWRRKGKTRNREGCVEARECRLRRKSCDVDPAIASGVSVDYPRNSINSFEEPRVSLDGYLLGRTYRLTPLVSVLGGAKIIRGSLDCCEKGNADLNRSNSRKKGTPMDVAELKLKSAAKPKVSLDGLDMFFGAKLMITERELMEWNSDSKAVKEEEGIGSVSVRPKLEPDPKDFAIGDSIRVLRAVDCEQLEKSRSRRWWGIWGLMSR